jgi:dTDP-glucose pyrophosphorylase
MKKENQKGTVNILIPMAGLGKRFLKAGIAIPKPLINVAGKLMIERAMESFTFLNKLSSHQIIFMILKDHDDSYNISYKLKEIFGDKIRIILLDHLARGQADTCLAAKEFIDNNNKLFIYNCDTYSSSDMWSTIENEDPDGIIVCFKSGDKRYSFVKLNETGYICRIAEKQVVSNLATTGMYYFRKGSDFVCAAQEAIKNNETYSGEFYIAPCFNKMIENGKKISMVLAKKYCIMGTPEELVNAKKHFYDTVLR